MRWIAPGYLISARSGGLVAQRFDADREQLTGDPMVVTDKVDHFRSTLRAQFAASRNGTIVYHSGTDQSQLTWFDRSGRITGTIGEVEGHLSARFSPDGTHIVFDRRGPQTQGWDLWTRDLARGVETRVTSDPGSEVTPVWTDGGRGIIYGADRGGSSPHLYRRDLNTGADVELRAGGPQQQSLDVSPDGKTLGMVERGPAGNFEMFLMPLARPQDAARLGAQTRFVELGPWFSPDNRAFAFSSSRSGRTEVYVASLAAPAAAVTAVGWLLATLEPGRARAHLPQSRWQVDGIADSHHADDRCRHGRSALQHPDGIVGGLRQGRRRTLPCRRVKAAGRCTAVVRALELASARAA
jgi:hypothetical protein